MRAEPILKALNETYAPPPDEDICDWVEKNVPQVQSSRASHVDLEQTPWFRDILRDLADSEVKEVNIVAPVGSGKTTLMESWISHIVARDPGPALFCVQSEAEAKIWAQTRLHPVLKSNKEIAPIYPKAKTKAKLLAVHFPHMPLFLGGANLNTLQSKSCRYIGIDEAWIWKEGMLEEARKRTHDRWNSKICRVSQGGVETDDWDQACQMGSRYEYQFRCRSCGHRAMLGRKDLKFEKIHQEGSEDEIDWKRTLETAHVECPECGETYTDNPADRRELTGSCEWVCVDDSGIPGVKTYHYNALAVSWIRFSDLAKELVVAQQETEAGDPASFRQYVQKRFGEFWKEEELFVTDEFETSDYHLTDYTAGQKIPDERIRVMAVDVQAQYYYVVIRAWRPDGASMLLYADTVNTERDLRALQGQYGVAPSQVFVDCAYDTPRVLAMCARNHWLGINSTKAPKFRHKTRDGRTVEKIWSPLKKQRTTSGLAAYYTFSSDSAKDIMGNIRAGKGVDFLLPKDVSKVYLRHLAGENKKKVFNKKTRHTEYQWVQTAPRCDFWDCEVMALVGAMIHRAV